jgi:hypothetical protein
VGTDINDDSTNLRSRSPLKAPKKDQQNLKRSMAQTINIINNAALAPPKTCLTPYEWSDEISYIKNMLVLEL